MNIDALRDRLLLVAQERLKNRPFDLEALRFELRNASPFGPLGIGQLSLLPTARGALRAALGEPDAFDRDLLQIIDVWAAKRPAPKIGALPPREDHLLHLSDKRAPEVDKGPRIKRAELKSRHLHHWRTIERDLKDASANGLSADAKAAGLGWWLEGAAVAWATVRGKITSTESMPASALARTIHKMAR